MLENHEDWAISSQDPYRVRFRDHRKGTVTIIVQLSRVDSNESKREGVLMTIGIYCIRKLIWDTYGKRNLRYDPVGIERYRVK